MIINKLQGQTVQHVGLELRTPVFTHGQFYVGVSRVTSVRNIKVIWDERDREGKTKNIVYSEVLLKGLILVDTSKVYICGLLIDMSRIYICDCDI